jgi:hypothetical protein
MATSSLRFGLGACFNDYIAPFAAHDVDQKRSSFVQDACRHMERPGKTAYFAICGNPSLMRIKRL